MYHGYICSSYVCYSQVSIDFSLLGASRTVQYSVLIRIESKIGLADFGPVVGPHVDPDRSLVRFRSKLGGPKDRTVDRSMEQKVRVFFPWAMATVCFRVRPSSFSHSSIPLLLFDPSSLCHCVWLASIHFSPTPHLLADLLACFWLFFAETALCSLSLPLHSSCLLPVFNSSVSLTRWLCASVPFCWIVCIYEINKQKWFG